MGGKHERKGPLSPLGYSFLRGHTLSGFLFREVDVSAYFHRPGPA